MEERETITYLTQLQAAEIDELLMGRIGFTIDQLMVSLKLHTFFEGFDVFCLLGAGNLSSQFIDCFYGILIAGTGWFKCCICDF